MAAFVKSLQAFSAARKLSGISLCSDLKLIQRVFSTRKYFIVDIHYNLRYILCHLSLKYLLRKKRSAYVVRFTACCICRVHMSMGWGNEWCLRLLGFSSGWLHRCILRPWLHLRERVHEKERISISCPNLHFLLFMK